MEPDDLQTLRLVEKQLMEKVTSFSTWEDLVTWVVENPAAVKVFVLQCLSDVIANDKARDVKLLETKSSIEG